VNVKCNLDRQTTYTPPNNKSAPSTQRRKGKCVQSDIKVMSRNLCLILLRHSRAIKVP